MDISLPLRNNLYISVYFVTSLCRFGMSPLNLFFDNGLVFFGFDLPVNLALPPRRRSTPATGDRHHVPEWPSLTH